MSVNATGTEIWLTLVQFYHAVDCPTAFVAQVFDRAKPAADLLEPVETVKPAGEPEKQASPDTTPLLHRIQEAILQVARRSSPAPRFGSICTPHSTPNFTLTCVVLRHTVFKTPPLSERLQHATLCFTRFPLSSILCLLSSLDICLSPPVFPLPLLSPTYQQSLAKNRPYHGLFRLSDEGGSGLVTLEALRHTLNMLGARLSEDETRMVADKLPAAERSDGMVDYEGLYRLLLETPPPPVRAQYHLSNASAGQKNRLLMPTVMLS